MLMHWNLQMPNQSLSSVQQPGFPQEQLQAIGVLLAADAAHL